MKIFYYPSSFDLKPIQKNQFNKALLAFKQEPRFFIDQKDIYQAKNFFDKIQKNKTPVFVFVFGGACASSKICQSLGLKTKNNIRVVTEICNEDIEAIQNQTLANLKKLSFVFISKSGKTYESLFYAQFIENLYTKKKLSLKNKLFVITENSKSLMLDWAKKQEADIWQLQKDGVPGRFSFFKGIGLLQFYIYGVCFLGALDQSKKTFDKWIEFLIFNKNKKEIWLCCMNPKLEGFCRWLEMAWSESLFKKQKTYPPLLRFIRCYDLQHAFVEELLAKKNDIALWALDTEFLDPKGVYLNKAQKAYKDLFSKRLKTLLRLNKISFLYCEMDLKKSSNLLDWIFLSYKLLFVLSSFFKADLFGNQGVNFFKIQKMNPLFRR